MCEQAPRISGLTLSALRDHVLDGGARRGRVGRRSTPDRQLTMPRVRVGGARVLEPLVDVDVRLVRLQRAQDADVGLVQREVGVVRLRLSDPGSSTFGLKCSGAVPCGMYIRKKRFGGAVVAAVAMRARRIAAGTDMPSATALRNMRRLTASAAREGAGRLRPRGMT